MESPLRFFDAAGGGAPAGRLIRCSIPIGRIYEAEIIKIFSRLLICFSFLVLKPADENGEIFSCTFR